MPSALSCPYLCAAARYRRTHDRQGPLHLPLKLGYKLRPAARAESVAVLLVPLVDQVFAYTIRLFGLALALLKLAQGQSARALRWRRQGRGHDDDRLAASNPRRLPRPPAVCVCMKIGSMNQSSDPVPSIDLASWP